MATRMYLSRNVFSIINPGTLGTWGSSVKAVKYLLNSASTDAAMLSTTYSGYGAGTVIYRQYISPPMSAGIAFTASTTYTMVQRGYESSTLADAFQQFYLAIVSNDGLTIRASFGAGEKDGTEMATSTTGRSNLNTGGLGTYTTVAGDRIVLELGWDQDGSGSYGVTMSEGYTGGTDLTGDGDTAIRQGWFEMSNTVTYTAEGAAPATNEDWDVSGYISAVLDEWV